MEKLKTWEMVKALTENPKLKFKSKTHIAYTEGSLLRLEYRFAGIKSSGANGNLRLLNANGFNADEWELVPEPVPFMEAVKAYVKGNMIECKYAGPDGEEQTSEYSKGGAYAQLCDDFGGTASTICPEEILYGEWFIK